MLIRPKRKESRAAPAVLWSGTAWQYWRGTPGSAQASVGRSGPSTAGLTSAPALPVISPPPGPGLLQMVTERVPLGAQLLMRCQGGVPVRPEGGEFSICFSVMGLSGATTLEGNPMSSPGSRQPSLSPPFPPLPHRSPHTGHGSLFAAPYTGQCLEQCPSVCEGARTEMVFKTVGEGSSQREAEWMLGSKHHSCPSQRILEGAHDLKIG